MGIIIEPLISQRAIRAINDATRIKVNLIIILEKPIEISAL